MPKMISPNFKRSFILAAEILFTSRVVSTVLASSSTDPNRSSPRYGPPLNSHNRGNTSAASTMSTDPGPLSRLVSRYHSLGFTNPGSSTGITIGSGQQANSHHHQNHHQNLHQSMSERGTNYTTSGHGTLSNSFGSSGSTNVMSQSARGPVSSRAGSHSSPSGNLSYSMEVPSVPALPRTLTLQGYTSSSLSYVPNQDHINDVSNANDDIPVNESAIPPIRHSAQPLVSARNISSTTSPNIISYTAPDHTSSSSNGSGNYSDIGSGGSASSGSANTIGSVTVINVPRPNLGTSTTTSATGTARVAEDSNTISSTSNGQNRSSPPTPQTANVPLCKVCYNELNVDDRFPVYPSICGHECCLSCLNNFHERKHGSDAIVFNPRGSSRASKAAAERFNFECMFCKAPYKASQVVKNHGSADMLSTLHDNLECHKQTLNTLQELEEQNRQLIDIKDSQSQVLAIERERAEVEQAVLESKLELENQKHAEEIERLTKSLEEALSASDSVSSTRSIQTTTTNTHSCSRSVSTGSNVGHTIGGGGQLRRSISANGTTFSEFGNNHGPGPLSRDTSPRISMFSPDIVDQIASSQHMNCQVTVAPCPNADQQIQNQSIASLRCPIPARPSSSSSYGSNSMGFSVSSSCERDNLSLIERQLIEKDVQLSEAEEAVVHSHKEENTMKNQKYDVIRKNHTLQGELHEERRKYKNEESECAHAMEIIAQKDEEIRKLLSLKNELNEDYVSKIEGLHRQIQDLQCQCNEYVFRNNEEINSLECEQERLNSAVSSLRALNGHLQEERDQLNQRVLQTERKMKETEKMNSQQYDRIQKNAIEHCRIIEKLESEVQSYKELEVSNDRFQRDLRQTMTLSNSSPSRSSTYGKSPHDSQSQKQKQMELETFERKLKLEKEHLDEKEKKIACFMVDMQNLLQCQRNEQGNIQLSSNNDALRNSLESLLVQQQSNSMSSSAFASDSRRSLLGSSGSPFASAVSLPSMSLMTPPPAHNTTDTNHDYDDYDSPRGHDRQRQNPSSSMTSFGKFLNLPDSSQLLLEEEIDSSHSQNSQSERSGLTGDSIDSGSDDISDSGPSLSLFTAPPPSPAGYTLSAPAPNRAVVHKNQKRSSNVIESPTTTSHSVPPLCLGSLSLNCSSSSSAACPNGSPRRPNNSMSSIRSNSVSHGPNGSTPRLGLGTNVSHCRSSRESAPQLTYMDPKTRRLNNLSSPVSSPRKAMTSRNANPSGSSNDHLSYTSGANGGTLINSRHSLGNNRSNLLSNLRGSHSATVPPGLSSNAGPFQRSTSSRNLISSHSASALTSNVTNTTNTLSSPSTVKSPINNRTSVGSSGNRVISQSQSEIDRTGSESPSPSPNQTRRPWK